jgi:MutS domain V
MHWIPIIMPILAPLLLMLPTLASAFVVPPPTPTHHHLPNVRIDEWPLLLLSHVLHATQNAIDECTSTTTTTTTVSLSSSSSSSFPDDLIDALDLSALMENVARHAATQRGYRALMAVVQQQQSSSSNSNNNKKKQNISSSSRMEKIRHRLQSSNQRKDKDVLYYDYNTLATTTTTTTTTLSPTKNYNNRNNKDKPPLLTIAQSVEQVQHHYMLVQEATHLLRPASSDNNNSNHNNNNACHTFYHPPIYCAAAAADDDDDTASSRSPWWNNNVDMVPPETDDDEWLWFSPTPNQFTAEHILQAEQVIGMLLRVQKWGCGGGNNNNNNKIPIMAPHLSKMAAEIDSTALQDVYDDIQGAVEIKRVRRSIMIMMDNIQGKSSSYTIRLRPDRFPILQLLHEKEQELLQRGGKAYDDQMVAVQAEIETTTHDIVAGLAQRILGASRSIDDGLDIVATLDTILSRAAYGMSLNGVFPTVQEKGAIHVDNFVHPVLAGAMGADAVIPIDLRLSTTDHQRQSPLEQEQALIISGPNGGGKSLSMKSFGVVSVLTKLGIPIPVSENKKSQQTARVDFFDHILVNIGDNQNVLDGESTWTSILNKCASIIETMNDNNNNNNNEQSSSSLVLLDEFGSAGTDPEACGAVAQAILEEMMTKPCKIVVTTHSPRLKALSFEHPNFGCAAVLLQRNHDDDNNNNSSDEYQLPSFRLEYGIIGESYALGAASRTRPALPSSVLSRASKLMSVQDGETEEKSTHKRYIQALTSSMELQLERTTHAALANEELQESLTKCRNAMIALAESYGNHLDRQLEKLQDTFQKLKQQQGSNELELVGETIAELKLVKKKIITQQERLAQQGLKVLPVDYKLSPGESVVILSNGEWEGMTAEVVTDVSTPNNPLLLKANEVLVRPSTMLHAWDDVTLGNLDLMTDRPLILQRHELAIWEYDGAIDDSYKTKPATSISDSKRKVASLLATINSVSTQKKAATTNKKTSAYVSSRERKAANKKKKMK